MAALAGIVHPDYRDPVGHLPRIDARRWVIQGNDSATSAELRYAAKALQALRIKRAREDRSAFLEYAFRDELTRKPFQQQWFHDEWNRAFGERNRVLILAPREHGKTGQIIGNVIWEIGHNPDIRIKLVAAADGRAKERLYAVRQHIENNPRVHEVFPNLVAQDKGEWSSHKIIVRRNARYPDATLEVMGVGASATGGRGDLLIGDDVTDRRNTLSNPQLMKMVNQAWKSDYTNLLPRDGRIWYICTPWHKDDNSYQLMSNPVYHVMRYDIGPNYDAIWPDHWASEDLYQRYLEIGSAEFNRAFRNLPIDYDTSHIKSEYFVYENFSESEEFRERAERFVFFTSYDTMGTPTGNRDQDYASCTIIAVDVERRKIWIVDSWHARLSTLRQAKQIIKEARRYKPFRILIEKVGQSSVDEWVYNLAPDLGAYVETTNPKKSKAARLLGVTPLLESGMVVFSDHLDPANEKWDPGRGCLQHELEDLPFGKHDDMADSFTQALDAARGYLLDEGVDPSENIYDIQVGVTGGKDEHPF